MKLHEQLTSPELSNKLHKLGVTTPSVFCRDWTGAKPDELEWAKDFEPYYCEDNVNAYSATELGEMLPRYLQVGKYSHELKIVRSSVWRFYYGDPSEVGGDCVYLTAGNDDTEADARAKMLIYLLENKLTPANEGSSDRSIQKD